MEVTMRKLSVFPKRVVEQVSIMGLMFGVMFLVGPSWASDLSGIVSDKKTHQSQQLDGQNQLDPGHRIIHGTVEGVNQNTIKVNAGEVGEMSPRYFDIEKANGDENVRVGDTLRVEVNLQTPGLFLMAEFLTGIP